MALTLLCLPSKTGDLGTTNVFLGIIAIAAVLETVSLVAVCIGAGLLGHRLRRFIDSVEQQQFVPAATRVHAILDDVKDVTSRMNTGAGWLDRMSSRIFGR